MSVLSDNGTMRLRSLFWVLGLLALLGLAACGASDPSVTAATPASIGQMQPGAQQSSTETEAVPSAASVEPAGAPSALPTVVAEPSAIPVAAHNPSETPASTVPVVLATLTAVTIRDNAWQTYRNVTAGYSVAHPDGWAIQEQTESDVISTTFAPSRGAPGIIVSVQAADAEPAEPRDLPNSKRCKPVVVGGINGLRCFDIVTLRVRVPTGSQGKSYIIASTGAGIDQAVYQRFLDSFTLTP